MAIQHLVLSGGGPAGFSIYGALRESAKTGVWNPDDIKSIWSTSAGAMIGAMIYITTNWDTLDNYIIRRPWDKLCSVNLYTLINAYMGCGLFNISVVEKMFSPLLLSNDYNVDITLQELYEKTGVEFHAFTTEINQNVCVDVSHETHPTWRLVDAVYASSALPGMFSPFIKDDKITVGKLAASKGNKVIRFSRFEVGEGIEKKEENFAEEVMAQVRGS